MSISTAFPQQILLLVLVFLHSATCEIRSFEGPLEAVSTYIHYSEGFLVAPGYVDISNLVFTTDDDGVYTPKVITDDDTDDYMKPGSKAKDDTVTNADDDETTVSADDGGRRLDEDEESAIDIVLFHEPKGCGANCDWTELGVGATNAQGELRWCCGEDAVALGMCTGRPGEYGRLILNATSFKGHRRSLSISSSGHQESSVKFGKLEERDDSGRYVLVMANCNAAGRNMTVSGSYTWKSKHGYLPGDLFGAMYFYLFLTIVYAVLFFSYAIAMHIYSEDGVAVQSWILGTVGIGLLEVFFKGGDFWVWNEDGRRFWFAMYIGILLGVAKRAISRCLLVMVSLGWGVVRDDLGPKMKKIIVLGIVYAGVSATSDLFQIFSIVENQTLSFTLEEEIFDIITILTFVVAAIDVTFYMWVLDSLSQTLQYLENMGQNIKLVQYLRLRLVLLLSILFAFVWAIFGIVNSNMEQEMLEEEQEWAISAIWELNYILVMAGVSYLWRPHQHAKDYQFQMELPQLGNDMEMDSNIADLDTNADVFDDDDDSEGYIDENGTNVNVTLT